ncbi:MAG: hypothetical protein RMK29_04490 [Myxococcales bacterium]|nr:hypothetical protein [Myxococcota bacterium]MDW8280947.1 hypothetical protein [Myxococcales bacterium]
MRNLISYVLLAALMAIASCEEQGAPLPPGSPGAPCTCTMEHPDSCRISYRNPQICPDLSPVKFCSRFVGSSYSTDVLIFNRGYAPLRIESVSLLGDEHCAFDPPQSSFIPGQSVIEHMRSESIRLTFRPRKLGPHFGVLRLVSNAENFRQLDIAVCGQGIMPGMPAGPDGGSCLECMRPTSDRPACGGPDGGT